MFIWRVNRIAVQSKAHQDGFALQFFFKKSDNRDTSTAALGNWRFAKRFHISVVCSFIF